MDSFVDICGLFNVGPGPFPAVLDLCGGLGGRDEHHSGLLASHGYVSLALEYIGFLNASGKLEHVDNTYFEVLYSCIIYL